MKNLLIGLCLIIFLFSACKDDTFTPPTVLDCQNGGESINGVCDCPTPWTGVLCNELATPARMTILSIDVTAFPFTNGGQSWDNNNGNPDVYFTFKEGTTPDPYSFNTTQINENCSNPLSCDFNIVNWYTTDMSKTFAIAAFDYDGSNLQPQIIGGNTFNPANYLQNGMPPNQINLVSGNQLYYTLFVGWEW